MTTDTRESNIMQMIYNKINDMIGAGNQLFSMQMPAQPLNYRMYQYDTSDRNSVLTRPFAIAEQEFRLSDQLFDVSPITAGSNGGKLSVVYHTLINNFVPKLDYLVPFIRDRAGLGNFLVENSGEVDEQGNPLSRMELCKKLYKEYLEAKNQWNKEKNDKFDELKKKGTDGLDNYARWLSSEGMVRQEELNNLYNDVVVRGLLHEVLTILGYLNSSSMAEELELSKQRMRNSARSSLDESMTVYPVQFQPNNWFKALSPNLTPEDLTMAKESIRDQYRAKQRELSRARAEMQQMELMSADSGLIKDLENKIETAKGTLNQAEAALIKNYGEGAVGIAKIYFRVMNKGGKLKDSFDAVKARQLGAADESDDVINSIKEAAKGIEKTYEAQQELTSSIANLTDLRAKKAQLESRDWQFNKISLDQRIQELQTEVDYYGDLLGGVYQEAAKTTRIEMERQSYDDETKTAVYQIGVAPTLTGGSFKLNIDGTETSDIDIIGANNSLDFDRTKEKILAGVKTIEKYNKTTTKVTGKVSAGYYLLTLVGNKATPAMGDTPAAPADSEPYVFAIEKKLLPEMEAKEPTLLPAPQTETEAEVSNMFQEIVLKITDSSDANETKLETQASSLKWNVSLWVASAGGGTNRLTSSASQYSEFFNQEMEIGFRVAKVSFDRGGWFNPQIFKMSAAFSHLADLRVSGNSLTTDKIKGTKSQTELQSLTHWQKDITDEQGTRKENHPLILPAFPVAMAIAKDITIRVKIAKGKGQATKSVVEESSSAGGGFLCFSVAGSSSSKSSSESALHGSHGEYYYIRIPGPQVIGYFLQFVDNDISTPYQPLTDASGNSPAVDAFGLYADAPRLLAGNGSNGGSGIGELKPDDSPLSLPEDTEE